MLSIYFSTDLDKFKHAGYSTVCTICLKRITDCKLLKCSGCKLVFYCSKAHQIQHWSKHKHICKAVQLLTKKTGVVCLFDNYIDEGYVQWRKFRLMLSHTCETIIGRDLSREENRLFLNPFTCKVCHTHRQNHMITCKDCSVISYCSEAHKLEDTTDHSLDCDKLKFSLDFDTFCRKPFLINVDILDAIFPQDMQTFINEFVIIRTEPHIDVIYAGSYISNALSLPLTLIYAIEESKIYKNVETLEIHIVGSGILESGAWWCWEYIFHYFKKLCSINLVFVGPESSKEFRPVLTCHDCQKSKCINSVVANCLYHEYVNNETHDPDIIVAYNCGFHEYENHVNNDIWKDSMPVFCRNPGKIVVFTSYTEDESVDDLKFFKKFSENENVQILIECKENPFKSLLPFNDWFSEKRTVYYNNNFINVVKT